MEKEEKNKRAWRPSEADFFLQWGNRKRLRCVRVRNRRHLEIYSNPSSNGDGRFCRNITSAGKQGFLSPLQPPARLTRNSEAATLRSENGKSGSGSAEEEDRYYATRGSVENGDVRVGEVFGGGGDENRAGGGGIVWPKLYITLSSKEKEEDFMAIKGCKPPQRPKKKRAKIIQRTLLLVSPGAWLSDMCQERYEVREKKVFNKKKPRGLKAMETDSE